MMLSPYWLAKFHYDTYRRKAGDVPPLDGLGQILLDTYNLAIPGNILKRWMQQFYYNN